MSALVREVTISREEFLRELPDAVGNRKFDVNGNTITVHEGGGKQIEIKLVDEGTVEKGELDLPRKQVHFHFKNMADDEVRGFMQHWDDSKLRVGG